MAPHDTTTEYPEILDRLDQFGMLGDPGSLVESLREFETGIRDQLVTLQSGLDDSDRNRVERSAHRIAGSSLTLGASRLGARASEVEHRAAAESLEKIRELVDAMASEAARVLDYVARVCAAPPDPATIRRGP